MYVCMYVCMHMKARIEGITDEAKRASTVDKIAERLGESEYWVKISKGLDKDSD